MKWMVLYAAPKGSASLTIRIIAYDAVVPMVMQESLAVSFY